MRGKRGGGGGGVGVGVDMKVSREGRRVFGLSHSLSHGALEIPTTLVQGDRVDHREQHSPVTVWLEKITLYRTYLRQMCKPVSVERSVPSLSKRVRIP